MNDYRVKCQCLKEFSNLNAESLGMLIITRQIDGVTHYMTRDELSLDDDEQCDGSVLDVETHSCEACHRCDKERCPGKQLF